MLLDGQLKKLESPICGDHAEHAHANQ